MRLLFHSCCGPCVTGCLETLRAENIEPELFWYNPNIHPYTEYTARRDSLALVAKTENLQFTIIDEYGLRDFIRGAGADIDNGPNTSGALRCMYCYRTRLERTALEACALGYDAFGTSLLVSPYQRHDDIRRIGEDIAERYKKPFYYRDFRPHYREGQQKARAAGLYMQKYCGCIFSEEERYVKKS